MAPRGHLVTVTFAQINIDDPGDCQNNYLKLYDGPDTSSLPVGPYCGVVRYINIYFHSSILRFLWYKLRYQGYVRACCKQEQTFFVVV